MFAARLPSGRGSGASASAGPGCSTLAGSGLGSARQARCARTRFSIVSARFFPRWKTNTIAANTARSSARRRPPPVACSDVRGSAVAPAPTTRPAPTAIVTTRPTIKNQTRHGLNFRGYWLCQFDHLAWLRLGVGDAQLRRQGERGFLLAAGVRGGAGRAIGEAAARVGAALVRRGVRRAPQGRSRDGRPVS